MKTIEEKIQGAVWVLLLDGVNDFLGSIDDDVPLFFTWFPPQKLRQVYPFFRLWTWQVVQAVLAQAGLPCYA